MHWSSFSVFLFSAEWILDWYLVKLA